MGKNKDEKEEKREEKREKEAHASARVSVKDLPAPERYLNRELSWVEFNARVLEEAQSPLVPLLERVKFLAIFAKNLDEFYEVRTPRLKASVAAGDDDVEADGYRPSDVLALCEKRIREIEIQAAACWASLVPELATAGVRVLGPADWTAEQRAAVDAAFEKAKPALVVRPVEPSGALPVVKNGQLFLAVGSNVGRLQSMVLFGTAASRLVKLPGPAGQFLYAKLEDAVRANLEKLLPGATAGHAWLLRLTRDTNFLMDETGEVELVRSIQEHTLNEDRERPSRLQYESGATALVVLEVARRQKLALADVFSFGSFACPADLFPISGIDLPALHDAPQPALQHPTIAAAKTLFEAIAKEDILLFHPYHSYDPVVKLVEQASVDPAVRAIHMTLYRTSSTSPIVTALAAAAKNGKKVNVLVEAKARFDEEANVQRAKGLEAAGAKVSLGVKGLKTHGKAILVEREEGAGGPGGTASPHGAKILRRYAHLATGNYNEKSAKIYGDLSLFTADEELTSELASVFGFVEGGPKPHEKTKRIWNAPDFLRARLNHMIEREADHARAGRKARIVAKLNALADRKIIEQLYAAADAGVEIDLLVRGVCTLRPGSGKVASRLRARRIVDRYLEHGRVLWFQNGATEQSGEPEVYLSSADWMGRNLDKRVELLFRLKGEKLIRQVKDFLDLQLADDVKGRKIERDGSSSRIGPPPGTIRCQDVQYDRLAKVSR